MIARRRSDEGNVFSCVCLCIGPPDIRQGNLPLSPDEALATCYSHLVVITGDVICEHILMTSHYLRVDWVACVPCSPWEEALLEVHLETPPSPWWRHVTCTLVLITSHYLRVDWVACIPCSPWEEALRKVHPGTHSHPDDVTRHMYWWRHITCR